jgi:hypothetical protein
MVDLAGSPSMSKPERVGACAKCHHRREVGARLLCQTCAEWESRRGSLSLWPVGGVS